MKLPHFLAAFAASLIALSPAPALAGTLQVDPIRLEISADRRTATLRVKNEEQTPVTIRAYPLAWTQEGGEDVYRDSSALIVSPPIFTIPAGGTQIVRVGLRGADAGGKAYRLIVEEVPQASPGGVQVALRLNLPLFAMMREGSQSDLAWSAERMPDGRRAIVATNRGDGHVRIDAAAASAANGLPADANINWGVVLPGQTRRWTLEAPTAVAGRR